MGISRIQWCDRVWNVVSGCSHSGSPGCDNCYAKRMALRLRGRFGYPADEPFRVTYHPDRLIEPFGWKKPQRIFVCSMGDLFHENLKYDWLDIIWMKMSIAYWHTFLVLTKRPENAISYFSKSCHEWAKFPNVWFGISVENQQCADERIPELLKLHKYFPVLFVSIEPTLGPIVLPQDFLALGQRAWCIMGCESGPGRRPFHMAWARDIRDQCEAANVPYFLKQAPDEYGRVIEMPFLDGKMYAGYPEVSK